MRSLVLLVGIAGFLAATGRQATAAPRWLPVHGIQPASVAHDSPVQTVQLSTALPPMGWNDWNHYGCKVSEQIIRQTADAVISSGMKDAGYQYINVDDCWMARSRDAHGALQPDPARFPHGIAALAQYIHRLGLKFGLYEDAGVSTCKGYPGSYGYEVQDAAQFTAWGVDYVKYDFCHHPFLNWAPDFNGIAVSYGPTRTQSYGVKTRTTTLGGSARYRACATCAGGYRVSYVGNGTGSLQFTVSHVPKSATFRLAVYFTNDVPGRIAFVTVNGISQGQLRFPSSGGWNHVSMLSTNVRLRAGLNTIRFDNPMTRVDNARYLYERMRDALQRTGRSIVFAVNDPSRRTRPWEWGASVGSLWRTGGDIQDTWQSVLTILDEQIGLDRYAVAGRWNDPDMLEIGNGGMTTAEYRAHFSLWSMIAAPLIAGNDVIHMDQITHDILTNAEVIAVDQDAAGTVGTRIASNPQYDVWVKPLADGSRAVAILNRANVTTTVHLAAQTLGTQPTGFYTARDLWTHTDVVLGGESVFTLDAHGVVMLRIQSAAP